MPNDTTQPMTQIGGPATTPAASQPLVAAQPIGHVQTIAAANPGHPPATSAIAAAQQQQPPPQGPPTTAAPAP